MNYDFKKLLDDAFISSKELKDLDHFNKALSKLILNEYVVPLVAKFCTYYEMDYLEVESGMPFFEEQNKDKDEILASYYFGINNKKEIFLGEKESNHVEQLTSLHLVDHGSGFLLIKSIYNYMRNLNTYRNADIKDRKNIKEELQNLQEYFKDTETPSENIF